MPQFWDLQTGQAVEVPPEHALDAIYSGKYGLAKGQEVHVLDRNGTPYPVQGAAQLQKALEQGYKLETSEQEAERVYGKRDAAAAGAAALRAMTFGLSDQFLVGAGIADEGTLAGLREGNPAISVGGEIGGLLLGGASGALGKAATKGATALGIQALKAAATPARVVTSLGRATSQRVEGKILEVLTTKGLKGAGSRIAAKTAAEAAAGVVEGSLYGVGQAITEDALGDTPTVAEALTAYVGPAALFGAAGGGLFGAGGALTKEAMSATKVASRKLSAYTRLKKSKAEQAFREGGALDELGISPPRNVANKTQAVREKWKREASEILFDEDVLPDGPIAKPTMLADEIVERTRQAAEAHGSAISELTKQLDELPGGDFPKLQTILDDIEGLKAKFANELDSAAAARQLDELKAWVEKNQPETFTDLFNLRQQPAFKNAWKATTETSAKNALKSTERLLQGYVLKGAKSLDDGLFQQLTKANDYYKRLIRLASKSKLPKLRQLDSGEFFADVMRRSAHNAAWRLIYGSTAMGALSGGVTGAVIGAGLGVGAKAMRGVVQKRAPELLTKVGQLRAIQMAVDSVDAKLGRAVGLMTKAPSIPGKGLASAFVLQKATGKHDREEAVKDLSFKLLSAQGNPEDFARKVGSVAGELEPNAPNLSVGVAETYARMLQVLLPHMPKPPSDSLLQPSAKDWRVPEAAQDKAAAVAAAVFDPISVVEEIAMGIADPRAIAAMQQMYPALSTHMLQSLIEKLGESEKEVRSGVKRQLAKFMGTVLDPLHTPFSTMQSQNVYSAAEQPQQEMGSVAKRENTELKSMGNHKTRSQIIGEPLK